MDAIRIAAVTINLTNDESSPSPASTGLRPLRDDAWLMSEPVIFPDG